MTVKFIIAQSNIESRLCRKKTKWWTDLPEGIVCPIPLAGGGGGASFEGEGMS